MKMIYRLQLVIHLVVGLGALAGGYGAVSDPYAPMGIPAAALEKGPFTSFLVPGLFLLVVLGLGNLVSAFLAAKKSRLSGYASGAMGAALAAWIVVQCWILQSIVALHVAFFAVGAVQGLLALALLWLRGDWPLGLLKERLAAKSAR